MSDTTLETVWNKFFAQRTKPLWDRYPGFYRALVVETDDPLRMHRVRFKLPDFHDYDLKPEQCPWAVPCFDFGTKRHGRWAHPIIGDWVWVTFERGHPYAPIWVGTADPTRRKYYSYPSVFGKTPVPVDNLGKGTKAPDDYLKEYMPKDERPMSHGWTDRYGSLDMSSSVGFFPTEHDVDPPHPDSDGVQRAQFESSTTKPKIDDPDVKYMVRLTKYGNYTILADQGYYWKNEFKGDFDKDEEFEIKRWKYLQKLLNENMPSSVDQDGEPIQFADQRRFEVKTRYGTRFELRDVGWAQAGPIESKTRQDEYDKPIIASKEKKNDFRWAKIRTKAGMLFQMYDKGAHPQDDLFIKRKLIEECAHKSEKEDEYWEKKDARWIRLISRYGFKIVIDDRGSDPKDAEGKEVPRGNGIMIKGRRSPGSHDKEPEKDERGFYFEFNEIHELNHILFGSPLGQVIEVNDRYEYIVLSSSIGHDYSMPWQKLKENEFIREPARIDKRKLELASHHMLIDLENEYIRFKTRVSKGTAPDTVVNPPGATDEHQGWEARDGSKGDGPWVEMVDCEHRGFWLTKDEKLGIWRGKKPFELYEWFDDKNQVIVIYNGASGGKIQIYCADGIEIKSKKLHVQTEQAIDVKVGTDIRIQADGTINIKAGAPINIQSSSAINIKASDSIKIGSDSSINLNATSDINLQAGGKVNVLSSDNRVRPPWVDGPNGADNPKPADTAEKIEKPTIPKVEPEDRAKTYNSPFEECPKDKVEHPITNQ